MMIAAAWVVGGIFFLSSALRHNSHADDCVAGLRRADPAAIVALALFVLAWPAIFVGAHVAKLRGR
jgi:hypothetical protein